MHTNESKETQIQRWDLKRWVLRSFLNWLSLLASLISDGNEFQIYGAQCLNAFSVHFLLALGGIFNRFWEPDLNRRLGTYCSKRSLKYDGAKAFMAKPLGALLNDEDTTAIEYSGIYKIKKFKNTFFFYCVNIHSKISLILSLWYFENTRFSLQPILPKSRDERVRFTPKYLMT